MTDDKSVHQTNFIPNKLQKQFIESKAKADLFSSRMGEGKSTALAWSALYHTRHNPGARWALVRDTFENMQATTLKTFFEWFPPGVYGTYNYTQRTFTWADGVAQGEVEFLGMDDPQDASKLMSRELAGIGFDEPAPAVGSVGIDELIFDIGLSRLRQKGMKWYCAKLAENNPDEHHWTYRRFVNPGTEGFKLWQPSEPENVENLPPSYYAELRRLWTHRPDLINRFVEGQFGYQQVGKAVTPQWSDRLHLATGLIAVPRHELILCWDWGHNPTCVITQKTPLGFWNILDAFVGEDIGVEELIIHVVRPHLAVKYPKFSLRHIGDPAGKQREQTSILRTPVRVVLKELGGHFQAGKVKFEARVEPLRAALTRVVSGRGMIQVDRADAKPIWHALRGGWHFHIAKTGLVSGEAVKNISSHPGDALSYGASILFPLGRRNTFDGKLATPDPGTYFGQKARPQIGPGVKIIEYPKQGEGLVFPKV